MTRLASNSILFCWLFVKNLSPYFGENAILSFVPLGNSLALHGTRLLGAEVLILSQKQLTQILIVCFQKKSLLFADTFVRGQQNRIESVTRLGEWQCAEAIP